MLIYQRVSFPPIELRFQWRKTNRTWPTFLLWFPENGGAPQRPPRSPYPQTNKRLWRFGKREPFWIKSWPLPVRMWGFMILLRKDQLRLPVHHECPEWSEKKSTPKWGDDMWWPSPNLWENKYPRNFGHELSPFHPLSNPPRKHQPS